MISMIRLQNRPYRDTALNNDNYKNVAILRVEIRQNRIFCKSGKHVYSSNPDMAKNFPLFFFYDKKIPRIPGVK